MVCLWAQEILGYYFTIVHRSNKMVEGIDSLNWRFVHLIIHHIDIASLLSYHDLSKNPRDYATTELSNLSNVNIKETDNTSSDPAPFLAINVLHIFSQDSTSNSDAEYSLKPYQFPSIITLHIHMRPFPNLRSILSLHKSITPNSVMAAFQIPQFL